jgi:dipeptidyl aminopeptidase/acylaminoacyl peptidase
MMRCKSWVIAAFLLSLAPTAVGQQRGFTLEEAMSAPFPAELVAAPAKGRLAWVFNTRGMRNIWVAEPPDYHARQITSYNQDDGQDVGELGWTPDADSIVYTHGGDFENDGTYPNPASLVAGVEQDVWVVTLSGGRPRKIGEGHSPAVRPDGKSVAYVLKGQIWMAPLEGNAKAEQVVHAKGVAGSLEWSPEGRELGFVSSRGDHSFIAIYNPTEKSLRYLDPSTDRDINPVWSPDGKRIAFMRIPASTEAFDFGPRRAGRPWSIRVADAASGVGRQVWRAEEGKGSVFRAVTAANQLMWAAGNLLIFPWERDAWTHLYSVPVDGGAAKLLTPGEFEVEDVALGQGGRELLFNSNQDDIDRRHLWREAVTGDLPEAVTRGDGIEFSPVLASDGTTIALLHSDAKWPARPAILEKSGSLRDIAREAIPADFPAIQTVTPEPVIISSADGLRIHAQVFLPPYASNGAKYPAVVFFHGGSRRQMLLGWHYMGYYSNAYALNQYLASRGYIVLAVNYRSGIGYGMEFREALNYGATGATEFNDVMGAGLYLRSRADVDAKRIGLWGGSYGGYLTALGLARASDLFAAGVDMHGVHDWNLEIPNFVPAYDPQRQPEAARLAFESSPLAYVKTWRSPVLLVHGDDDRNVPFAETVHLVEALRNQGVEFRELIFPDEIHDFLTHRRWLEAYHAAADFLDQHLKN